VPWFINGDDMKKERRRRKERKREIVKRKKKKGVGINSSQSAYAEFQNKKMLTTFR
jgi:hypothetical protein